MLNETTAFGVTTLLPARAPTRPLAFAVIEESPRQVFSSLDSCFAISARCSKEHKASRINPQRHVTIRATWCTSFDCACVRSLIHGGSKSELLCYLPETSKKARGRGWRGSLI